MGSGRRPSTRGAHREVRQAAIDYIEQHVPQPITVAEVARAAYTSERQLQRVFAETGAITVRGYIARARMRRARALVLQSDATLTEIARAVGFGHVSAFVKAFRVHHGLPPTQLRRGDVADPPISRRS